MKFKIIKLFFGLCLLLMTYQIEAQRFIGSVVAGMNTSQIEGDDVHGFLKFGVNAGAGVTLPLTRNQKWTVSTELLYVQKGSYKHCSEGYFDTVNYGAGMFSDVDNSISFNPRVKCNISLDYVQIPVLFHYEDMKSGCMFGLGFSWSRLIRAKEIYNGYTRTTNIRSGTFKTSDWSVLADVNIRLYKNLSLNVRYEYSLTPIRKMNFEYKKNDGSVVAETHSLYNHLLSFRLIYYINEKFIRNTSTNRKGELIGTKWIRDIPTY